MIRILCLMVLCAILSSCAELGEMKENLNHSPMARSLGSFQLNPVQENSYWYNGSSYEYNEYQIEITSGPVQSRIRWNNRIVGTTPLIYRFTGTIEKGERIHIQAVPIDEELATQEAVLHVVDELPRKIHFDMNKK